MVWTSAGAAAAGVDRPANTKPKQRRRRRSIGAAVTFMRMIINSRSARRVAQAAEETRQAQPVRRAAPLGFQPLELHHIVDAPVEEGAGFGPALAPVLQ